MSRSSDTGARRGAGGRGGGELRPHADEAGSVDPGPGPGDRRSGESDPVRDEDRRPPGRRPPLVVLAEDSPDVQGVVRHALEADGCDVRVADDGDEALRLLADLESDLLILDLMMPRVSGLDVLTALHESGRLERLPVLVLTARSGEDDIVACFRMGATDYVTKPFMLRELRARARALLARPAAARDELRGGPAAT